MIQRITLGLILGLLATLFSLSQDPYIHHVVLHHFTRVLEQALDCSCICNIESIHLISPSLVLRNVRMSARDTTNWQWQADSYITSFSWWQFLLTGTADLHISLSNVRASSGLHQDKVAIWPHLQRLMTGPVGVPCTIRTLMLDDVQLEIADDHNDTSCVLNWHSVVERQGNDFAVHTTLNQASIRYHQVDYLKDFKGQVTAVVQAESVAAFTAHATVAWPQQEPLPCIIQGQWQETQGNCSLVADDGSLSLLLSVAAQSPQEGYAITASGTLPLSLLMAARGISTALTGTVSYTAQTTVKEGACVATEMRATMPVLQKHEQVIAQDLKVHLWQKEDTLHLEGQGMCVGILAQIQGSWQTQKGGSLAITNQEPIILAHTAVTVAPRALSLRAVCDIAGAIKAYGAASFTMGEKFYHLAGQVALADATLKSPVTISCTADGKKVITAVFSCEKDEQFLEIIADAATLGEMATATGIVFPRISGTATLCVASEKNEVYAWRIHIDEGILCIPTTYTVMQEMQAHGFFDMHTHRLVVDHAQATLTKGSVCIDNAVFRFEQGTLATATVPFIAQHCLLTLSTDIFAELSGAALLSYAKGAMPQVQGHFMIDKAQMKENIFSTAFYKQMGEKKEQKGLLPVALACSVETRDPVRIKTSFLETSAHVALQLGNTSAAPALSGIISFKEGQLQFPYRPLYITKAIVQCAAEHPDDPLIELVARNTIKNYEITLAITGSLKDHQVTLESTPSLTENQIISLLLVGSQEESLNTIVPAVVMENVRSLLFESEHAPIKLAQYFQHLLTPFKKVHLVPRFADQTARGGLRGAIEVEVNDRTRALIQKNFSLTEDTRVELEYQISDDVTIRGIRDEKRDVNAEVEMRWKF